MKLFQWNELLPMKWTFPDEMNFSRWNELFPMKRTFTTKWTFPDEMNFSRWNELFPMKWTFPDETNFYRWMNFYEQMNFSRWNKLLLMKRTFTMLIPISCEGLLVEPVYACIIADIHCWTRPDASGPCMHGRMLRGVIMHALCVVAQLLWKHTSCSLYVCLYRTQVLACSTCYVQNGNVALFTYASKEKSRMHMCWGAPVWMVFFLSSFFHHRFFLADGHYDLYQQTLQILYFLKYCSRITRDKVYLLKKIKVNLFKKSRCIFF
jgi:hypothetical protein